MAKNTKWNLDKIKSGFERYYKENSRYPTAQEVDTCAYLPSARQIQRKFGGLPKLREQLRLSGPIDFTKGEYSSKRAFDINKRAFALEKDVYDYLVKIFGKPFVHREFFFNDDRRNRTDFYVHAKDGNFSVDVFFPKDKRSFFGCLNSKLRAYKGIVQIDYPIIFLMMNDDLAGEEEINRFIQNKKIKLKGNQIVMNLKSLKEFCSKKKPFSIGDL